MRDEAGRLVDWAAPGNESVCGVTTQVFRRALCPAPDSWSPLLNSRPDEVFLVLNGTYAEPKIRSGPPASKDRTKVNGMFVSRGKIGKMAKNTSRLMPWLAGIQIRPIKEVYSQPSD